MAQIFLRIFAKKRLEFLGRSANIKGAILRSILANEDKNACIVFSCVGHFQWQTDIGNSSIRNCRSMCDVCFCLQVYGLQSSKRVPFL